MDTGEQPKPSQSAVEPASKSQSPAPVTTREKKGLFGRFFRRGERIDDDQPQTTQPEENPQPASIPEAKKDPETLKQELIAEVGSLVDLQRAIFEDKDYLHWTGSGPGKYPNSEIDRRAEKAGIDSNTFKQQEAARVNGMEATVKQKSQELIGKMEAAREILGDFCGVIQDGEDKAVVILKPLHRTVVQRVYDPWRKPEMANYERKYAQPSELEKRLLYTKTDQQEEIFFVNVHGVQKLVVPTDRQVDWANEHVRRFNSGVDASIQAQQATVRDNQDAPGGTLNILLGLLNGEKPENDFNGLQYTILGRFGESRGDDRIGERYIAFAEDAGSHRTYQVTTNVDAQEAMQRSMEVAKKEGSLIWLYPSQE